jgi:hypothetical protein
MIGLRLLASIAALALPATLLGQVPNRGRLISTVSPAALGEPVGISVGISSLNNYFETRLAVGDLAFGRGALRVIGARQSQFDGFGIGYAAPLASRVLSPSFATTLGGELSLGYLGTDYVFRVPAANKGTSVNAQLALPFSLRAAAGQYISFTPYIAPYAELGSTTLARYQPAGCDLFANCQLVYGARERTANLGIAGGMRLRIWHFGLDGGVTGVPANHARGGAWSFATSLRF